MRRFRDYNIKPQDVDSDEYTLRLMLATNHKGLQDHCDLYGDDGELHCHSCDIDFVRDSPSDIRKALDQIGIKRLALRNEAEQ